MDPSGQGMMPYFYQTLIPAAGPLHTVHMLPPVTSSGTPVFATAMTGQQLTTESHGPIHQPTPPIKVIPTANLYLCNAANNATETLAGVEEDSKEKTFVGHVEKSYKELTSRKIKDTLSSFLPKIPGEVDSMDTHPETMLQDLIEHRPIGGKEFHPLSNQSLLGFRLKPGPLPEQYKMDPASLEAKPPHRKRKRKHKNIDKSEEGADPGPPTTQFEMPEDACNFIKEEPVHSMIRPSAISGLPGSNVTTVISRNTVYSTAVGGASVAGPPAPLMMDQRIQNYEKEKRKKKKNRDKKDRKEKKEKKRKRDKHHGQEAHSSTPSQPTTLTPSLQPPHTYTQYTTQYNNMQ